MEIKPKNRCGYRLALCIYAKTVIKPLIYYTLVYFTSYHFTKHTYLFIIFYLRKRFITQNLNKESQGIKEFRIFIG